MITAEEARDVVRFLKTNHWDDEAAHGMEDSLYTKVLEAVAAGSPESGELARIALETREIGFRRWAA